MQPCKNNYKYRNIHYQYTLINSVYHETLAFLVIETSMCDNIFSYAIAQNNMVDVPWSF